MTNGMKSLSEAPTPYKDIGAAPISRAASPEVLTIFKGPTVAIRKH